MHRQAHVTLVNGAETSAISIADRGLAYGDGLFETMRVVNGVIPLIDQHIARFKQGAKALGLGALKGLEADFKAYVKQGLNEISGDALMKVIITRGTGGRGYEPPTGAHPTFIVQVFDLPQFDSAYYQKGIKVKLCDYILPSQPLLAGVKHLNRLDQVLASRELKSEQEGLLCDMNGNVIEGLKSNLIIFEKASVVTPLLDHCGVRGTLRQYLLSNVKKLGFDIKEEAVSVDRLNQAKGAVLINSVFGCWPVAKIDQQTFSIDSRCETIQQFLANELAYR